MKLRRFGRRFLVFINISISLIFVLACLAPYVDPKEWWMISLLGFGFPLLFIVVVINLVLWIVLRSRQWIIPFISLLIGYKSIAVFFAFNNPKEFDFKKDNQTIRLVTWNVARFIELKRNNNAGSQTRLKMLDLIRQQNADILCLQELHSSDIPEYYDNINNLKYPYFYFSAEADGDYHYYGCAIFSRFPILDSGKVRYPRPTVPDPLVFVDIQIPNDTIRVYTTHLQSPQFKETDYENIEDIKQTEDGAIDNSKAVFSKVGRALKSRSIQAEIIQQVLQESPYKKIVTGDMNDIPNSYTYFTIRGDMQDAFLKKGFGFGRTFSRLAPTLRIDYIFADQSFKILQFTRHVKNYSDHYMLVADLKVDNTN